MEHTTMGDIPVVLALVGGVTDTNQQSLNQLLEQFLLQYHIQFFIPIPDQREMKTSIFYCTTGSVIL